MIRPNLIAEGVKPCAEYVLDRIDDNRRTMEVFVNPSGAIYISRHNESRHPYEWLIGTYTAAKARDNPEMIADDLAARLLEIAGAAR